MSSLASKLLVMSVMFVDMRFIKIFMIENISIHWLTVQVKFVKSIIPEEKFSKTTKLPNLLPVKKFV